MRAMMMSVASYICAALGREKRPASARLLSSYYEPGIHLEQCQNAMGIKRLSTRSALQPIKQWSQDHDFPRANFIRQCLPELASIPAVHLYWELWTSWRPPRSAFACVLGACITRLPNRLEQANRLPGSARQKLLGSRARSCCCGSGRLRFSEEGTGSRPPPLTWGRGEVA